MLQTEFVIKELNNHLEKNGLYFIQSIKEEEKANAEIQNEWERKFGEALSIDFKKYGNLNISTSNHFFELFGDQGASSWMVIITIEDHSTDKPITLGFKAVLNIMKTRVAMQEDSIRQITYSGSNQKARKIFEKLRAIEKLGYESSLSLKSLLTE